MLDDEQPLPSGPSTGGILKRLGRLWSAPRQDVTPKRDAKMPRPATNKPRPDRGEEPLEVSVSRRYLNQLRKLQVDLESYVRGYTLGVEAVRPCQELKRTLSKGTKDPPTLEQVDWDNIHSGLDGILSIVSRFDPLVRKDCNKEGEQLFDFEKELSKVTDDVAKRNRDPSRRTIVDEVGRKADRTIVDDVGRGVDQTATAVGKVANRCRQMAEGRLKRLEDCINRMFREIQPPPRARQETRSSYFSDKRKEEKASAGARASKGSSAYKVKTGGHSAPNRTPS